jgi:hypothetical protein
MEGWEFSRPMTMIRGKVQANVSLREGGRRGDEGSWYAHVAGRGR